MENKRDKTWTFSFLRDKLRRPKKVIPGTDPAAPAQAAQQPIETSQVASFPFGTLGEHPEADVVNFLVILIRAVVAIHGVASIPGCPATGEEVKNHLKQLPKFLDTEQLNKALKSPRTKQEELLLWICNTYGRVVVLAKDNLRIPGLADDVQQFVVAKQVNVDRYAQFEDEVRKKAGKSKLLFHGTSLENLLLILHKGLTASYDTRLGTGCFMGEKPVTAFIYAYHRACLKRNKPPSAKWTDDKWEWKSARDRAIVLGCEVAGSGRTVYDNSEKSGKVHVVTNLPSIAVRYVFLLPDRKYKNREEVQKEYKVPEREVVKEAMVEAFKRFPTTGQMEEEKKKEEEEAKKNIEEAKSMLELLNIPQGPQMVDEGICMREQLNLPAVPVAA